MYNDFKRRTKTSKEFTKCIIFEEEKTEQRKPIQIITIAFECVLCIVYILIIDIFFFDKLITLSNFCFKNAEDD
jgi:hypothetical protein